MNSWVPNTLQALLKRNDAECTPLMNRVRRILTTSSPMLYLSIYDMTNDYAALYMSDQSDTIYLYRDSSCSKLKPLYKSKYSSSLRNVTNHIKVGLDGHNNTRFDMNWILQILALDSSKRYESDKDLLEYRIDTELNKSKENDKNTSIDPIVCFISLEDNEDVVSISSETSIASIASSKSIANSVSSSISNKSITNVINVVKNKKPIPLHLRPKWKK
jgi:hypothetical protein